MFEHLLSGIDTDIVHRIFKIQVQLAPTAQNSAVQTNKRAEPMNPLESPITQAAKKMQTNAPNTGAPQPVVSAQKLGRNDPCWCGSGKKFKKCHINREPQTVAEKEAYSLYYSNYGEWQKRYGGGK